MQACIEEEGWGKKMSGRHDGHGQVGLKNFIETIWIENFQAVLSCYFATKVYPISDMKPPCQANLQLQKLPLQKIQL